MCFYLNRGRPSLSQAAETNLWESHVGVMWVYEFVLYCPSNNRLNVA